MGDPVAHSLSPLMHNHAYKVLGISEKFYFCAARVGVENRVAALESIRALNICCVSVTLPHKEAFSRLIEELDQDAKEIGAVNTVLNNQGTLFGLNTDVAGVLEPLKKRLSLNGARVALLGAGGAARAAAFALTKEGAKLGIFNRSLDRALELKQSFTAELASDLTNLEQLKDFQIIINATSIGLTSKESIIEARHFSREQLVFDMIYNPLETTFLQNAKGAGCETISGLEMFVAQGAKQFELATGETAPRAEMYTVVEKYLLRKTAGTVKV